MSVLITGGSGLLAVNAAAALRGAHHVTLGLHERRIGMRGCAAVPVGLDTVDSVVAAIDQARPELLIHTAALTSIEACEADPVKARRVNAEMAGNVARACTLRRTRLAHISTDHLFSGAQAMLDEGAPPHPLNIYAQSKLQAESEVLRHCPDALVARTNIYGWGTAYRKSFSDSIIEALRAGRAANLFTDVYYTPILIEALTGAVVELAAKGAHGVYNIVGDERISKHEFGVRLARTFGLDAGLIRQTCLADARDLVPRPLDMSLCNLKASRTLARRLGGVDSHVSRLRAQEEDGLAAELLAIECLPESMRT